VKRYLKVWWIYTINTLQVQLNVARWGVLLFLFSKVLRFGAFIFFLVILVKATKVLAGYNLDQVILFFLTFNLLDMTSQMFLREVYRFRAAIITGSFDFYLLKPVNPLFRALFTGSDFLDFITLVPLVIAVIYYINKLHLLSALNLAGFILMLLTGFAIALSFHILVLCLGILTTEVDNAVFVYRDLISMGRVPVDIYMEPIRGLITFVIPVGIMMSFPAKALMGILTWPLMVYAVFLAVFLLFTSLKIWQFALKRYSSASS